MALDVARAAYRAIEQSIIGNTITLASALAGSSLVAAAAELVIPMAQAEADQAASAAVARAE